jgi:hypothetical protein
VFGLAIVMFGAITAYFSTRFPAKAEAIETAAGFLLIGGFALIGCALPLMV